MESVVSEAVVAAGVDADPVRRIVSASPPAVTHRHIDRTRLDRIAIAIIAGGTPTQAPGNWERPRGGRRPSTMPDEDVSVRVFSGPAPARRQDRLDESPRNSCLSRCIVVERGLAKANRLLVAAQVLYAIVTGSQMRLELSALRWLKRLVEVLHQEVDDVTAGQHSD